MKISVIAGNTERSEHDNRLKRVSHFLQKALHREGNRLCAEAELDFAVVYDIGKENSLCDEHRSDTNCADDVADIHHHQLTADSADCHADIAGGGNTERSLIGFALRHIFCKNRKKQKTDG